MGINFLGEAIHLQFNKGWCDFIDFDFQNSKKVINNSTANCEGPGGITVRWLL